MTLSNKAISKLLRITKESFSSFLNNLFLIFDTVNYLRDKAKLGEDEDIIEMDEIRMVTKRY